MLAVMKRPGFALLVASPLVVLTVWFATGLLVRAGAPALGSTIRVSGSSSDSSTGGTSPASPTGTASTAGDASPPTSGATPPSSSRHPPSNSEPSQLPSGAAAVTDAGVCPAGDDDDDDPDEDDDDPDDWCDD